MPQGDKDKYTDRQKRKAQHIEEGYEKRGTPRKEAEARAWATVNNESGEATSRVRAAARRTPTSRPRVVDVPTSPVPQSNALRLRERVGKLGAETEMAERRAMSKTTHKPLGEGGPKQRGSGIERESDPALQKESRQAVKNQSEVDPEDYPDRSQTPV